MGVEEDPISMAKKLEALEDADLDSLDVTEKDIEAAERDAAMVDTEVANTLQEAGKSKDPTLLQLRADGAKSTGDESDYLEDEEMMNGGDEDEEAAAAGDEGEEADDAGEYAADEGASDKDEYYQDADG